MKATPGGSVHAAFEALPPSVTIGTLLQTFTAFVVEVPAIAEASAGRKEAHRAH
jgi:hypothetical protein